MDAIKTIYLAGKIEANDWRHDIVKGLRDSSPLSASCQCLDGEGSLSPWPILQNAIFDRFHYTGPYFVEGDHVSFHGEGSHGVRSFDADNIFEDLSDDEIRVQILGHAGPPYSLGGLPYRLIVRRCQEAIKHSDLIFAWIDDPTCYGTIAEIGYAKALGKIVWIAGTKPYRDFNFIYEMVDDRKFQRIHPTEHLQLMLDQYRRSHPQFGSPIEQAFWNAWESLPGNHSVQFHLTPQYSIGRYRVDFAHIRTKTAIELDGFASHSSTDDIANDRKRQREIEAMGWYVFRFGGKEIHKDAQRCAEDTRMLLIKRGTVL